MPTKLNKMSNSSCECILIKKHSNSRNFRVHCGKDRPGNRPSSSCYVSVHENISLAKAEIGEKFYVYCTPLFSQFNILNMLSSVGVNSLGEMVSPLSYYSLDPDFLTLFV